MPFYGQYKDPKSIAIIILILISTCFISSSKSCKDYRADYNSSRVLNYQQELNELEKICALNKSDIKGQLECLDRRNQIKEKFIKDNPSINLGKE